MKRVFLATITLACIFGCSKDEGPGDVATAKKASAAAPKSAKDLPDTMPAEARKQAEASMGAQNAMEAQMRAQAEAMKKAQAGAR